MRYSSKSEGYDILQQERRQLNYENSILFNLRGILIIN